MTAARRLPAATRQPAAIGGIGQGPDPILQRRAALAFAASGERGLVDAEDAFEFDVDAIADSTGAVVIGQDLVDGGAIQISATKLSGGRPVAPVAGAEGDPWPRNST